MPITGDEEALDGIVHLESEAGLEDDRRRALSGVRDVLDEFQSKSGGPRAPNLLRGHSGRLERALTTPKDAF